MRAAASQVTAAGVLSMLAASLLSQAALPGGAMPFCVPLVAAMILLHRPALPVAVGCLAGLLLRWEPVGWENGWQLAACLILIALVQKGWNWKPWKVSCAACAAMLLPLPFVANRVDTLIACASGALAAGLLTPVYMRALLSVSPPHRAMTNDDKLCCLIVLCAISLGGQWLRVEMVTLGDAFAALVVLSVAWTAGPGLALPAGALLGLSLMVSGATFDMLAMLAVLGGLSGALSGNKRVMPIIGGLLGCALTAYAQRGVDQVIQMLPSIAIGAALFATLPRRWLDAMRGLLDAGETAVSEAGAVAASYLLSSYAEAMGGMARALPLPDSADEAQPVELLACRLCTGCERQQTCWDAKRDASIRLLDGVLLACSEQASAVEVEQAARMSGCLRSEEMFGLASAMIQARLRQEKEDARRLEARAWALEQIRGQSRALSQLAERIGDGCVETAQARAAICQAMPALRGRPEALSVVRFADRLHVWLDVRSAAGQAERIENALGAALGFKMEWLDLRGGGGDTLLFVERPKLRLVVGRASTPIAGEDISGDCALHERLDANRYMLAISDGMGFGGAARAESQAALTLLHQAMRAGYSRGDALRLVNGLLVACRGDEMYATMDMCVVDLDSGEAALEKLGACPSFLLRAGKCKRIGGDALPMGILDAVRPRALAARLVPGDLLLMVSDGVVDAFGGEESALLRAMGGLSAGDRMPTPQRFADTLLRRALERCGGAALDDMTVLAAKVEEASGGLPIPNLPASWRRIFFHWYNAPAPQAGRPPSVPFFVAHSLATKPCSDSSTYRTNCREVASDEKPGPFSDRFYAVPLLRRARAGE